MFTTRPELRGTFGVVSSTHWLASAVGMSILEPMPRPVTSSVPPQRFRHVSFS